MKHVLRNLTFLALMIVLAGCGTEKAPPHYGMYFVKGKNFVEIPLSFGGPDISQPFVLSPETQPQIAIWDPDVNLSLFNLVLMEPTSRRSGFDPKVAVAFDANSGDNGLVTMRPKDPLTPDVYCLIQGDYLTTPDRIKHWCFEVEGKKSEQAQSTPNENPPSQQAPTPMPIAAPPIECTAPLNLDT